MQIFSKKIFIIALVVISLLIVWMTKHKSKPTVKPESTTQEQVVKKDQVTNEKPKIIATKPDPLEEAIISASEVVEITFNRPLENSGEFKVKTDPKIDFKIELSGDRKTAKIIPAKPYELGTTYTLFIGTETKFDGIGRWGEDKIFHFRTIKYRGV